MHKILAYFVEIYHFHKLPKYVEFVYADPISVR